MQVTGYRLQATKLQAANYGLQGTRCKLQATGYGRRATDQERRGRRCRLPTPGHERESQPGPAPGRTTAEFSERTGSRWHRLLIRSGCVATSSTLAVHHPAPSRARIQSIFHIDPQRQTTATIPLTTAVHTVATASRRCFHALSAEPVNTKSPSGADPSEAAADAQPAGQSDTGCWPSMGWKWVAGTAREELKQNASVCVLSTRDSTICRLPASIAEVGEDGLPLGICPSLGNRTGIKDSAREAPQTTATVTTLA